MSTNKIAVYSLPDLKNTTDDALPNYLTSLKFKQSHVLTDVRLALGYLAVAIAGATFYADYKLGWEATKGWTLWAVIVYFILNSALTVWIWRFERGKIFVGERNNTLLSIASSVTKHNPLYQIKVRYSEAKGGDWQTKDLSAPFTKWFDADGHFVAAPFQQWLASEIPVIGQADPQKNKATSPNANADGNSSTLAKVGAASLGPNGLEGLGSPESNDAAPSMTPRSKKKKRQA